MLEECKFDQMQFAYLSKCSSTQAMLVLVETIKSGLTAGSSAGVVFSGIMHFRTCIRDLCCREYLRLLQMEEGHVLRVLYEKS